MHLEIFSNSPSNLSRILLQIPLSPFKSGDQSYLVVHLLLLQTCWFNFDTQKTLFPFLNVFTIEDALSVQLSTFSNTNVAQ